MTDVRSRNIEASVTVDGQSFDTTELEVIRATSSAGEAVIKGFTDNPSAIDLESPVTVQIKQNRTDGDEISLATTAFRGRVKKVEKNYEGVTTVFAYDQLADLRRKQVRLNIEQPTFAHEIAQTIIEDSEFTLVRDSIELLQGTDQFYVAGGSKFPGGFTRIKPTYGSAQSGDSLYYVLNDIAAKLGGILWVDRRNNVRIEPYPEYHKQGELKEIIEFTEGNEDIGDKKVIVRGSSPTGNLGSAAFSLYNQDRPESEARSQVTVGESNPPTKTIESQDIVTKKGTEKFAYGDRQQAGINVNAGEVTVSGNAQFELFDLVDIPIEFISVPPSDQTRLGRTNPTILNDEFAINRVTHTIDSEEGYKTTITLSPGIQDIIDGIEGVADRIKQQALARIEENRDDERDLYTGNR